MNPLRILLAILLATSPSGQANTQAREPGKLNLAPPPALLIPGSAKSSATGEKSDARNQLPEIGDATGTLLTPLQEKELGEAFFRSLHMETQVSEDAEVSDYIQSIGQKLAVNSANPQQVFHFFVVEDPVINAFAGPGGYIGVNSGLILASEAESELASVLAHEIAHVTQRHLYQAYQAAGRLSLPTAAAMLAAILIGAKTGSAQAGQAAIIAAQAANTQMQINFTRDNEAEADSVGMQNLSHSEYDPRSMPAFFERLQQSTRYSGRNVPEFLLTHPVTVSRISDTRARAESFPYRQYPDSFPFQLVRAKLRAQTSSDPKQALEYFKAVQGQGTAQQQDVSRYGMALALIANFHAAEALPMLKALIARYPEQSHFLTALARGQKESGDHDGALRTYQEAYTQFPDSRAIALEYIKVLLARGRPDSTRKLLTEYIHRHGYSPQVYELLAQSLGALGEEAESHRYLAEYYYAVGQTREAILQLRIARRVSKESFYVSAVIDERLRQFVAEEQERNQQKR